MEKNSLNSFSEIISFYENSVLLNRLNSVLYDSGNSTRGFVTTWGVGWGGREFQEGGDIGMLLLLLSHFSRVRLCATI